MDDEKGVLYYDAKLEYVSDLLLPDWHALCWDRTSCGITLQVCFGEFRQHVPLFTKCHLWTLR